MEPDQRRYAQLVLFALVLALAVIMLGAYVRLSDAGLGCPDWPGCYGQLVVPDQANSIADANRAYPDRPLETSKAWKEMMHRYLAGALGLVILVLVLWVWKSGWHGSLPRRLSLLLAVLIVFQVLLGMWTVTLLLKPLVVVLHLIGGMSIVALLWLLWLRRCAVSAGENLRKHKPAALVALMVVVVQIILGGWTSSNYAATACPDFPTCQQSLWPEADYSEAFVLWRGLGVNYEGGVLETPARVAIHFVHRLGAIAVLFTIGFLLVRSFPESRGLERIALLAMTVLLLLQVSLGIGLIKFGFPLLTAVAHNGMAAFLLLSVVTVNYLAFAGSESSS